MLLFEGPAVEKKFKKKKKSSYSLVIIFSKE